MFHPRHRYLLLVASPALFLAFTVGVATAQVSDALKTIDNPGGGVVVYGPLTDLRSTSGAMVFMLKQVHGHFGERPELGKFFQTSGSDSTAAFFNVTDRLRGNIRVAGLVIVSVPKNGTATAAVLYDEAERFATTEPAMMASLNAAWHNDSMSSRSTSPASVIAGGAIGEGSPQQLRTATAFDRSASIG